MKIKLSSWVSTKTEDFYILVHVLLFSHRALFLLFLKQTKEDVQSASDVEVTVKMPGKVRLVGQWQENGFSEDEAGGETTPLQQKDRYGITRLVEESNLWTFFVLPDKQPHTLKASLRSLLVANSNFYIRDYHDPSSDHPVCQPDVGCLRKRYLFSMPHYYHIIKYDEHIFILVLVFTFLFLPAPRPTKEWN